MSTLLWSWKDRNKGNPRLFPLIKISELSTSYRSGLSLSSVFLRALIQKRRAFVDLTVVLLVGDSSRRTLHVFKMEEGREPQDEILLLHEMRALRGEFLVAIEGNQRSIATTGESNLPQKN